MLVCGGWEVNLGAWVLWKSSKLNQLSNNSSLFKQKNTQKPSSKLKIKDSFFIWTKGIKEKPTGRHFVDARALRASAEADREGASGPRRSVGI